MSTAVIGIVLTLLGLGMTAGTILYKMSAGFTEVSVKLTHTDEKIDKLELQVKSDNASTNAKVDRIEQEHNDTRLQVARLDGKLDHIQKLEGGKNGT